MSLHGERHRIRMVFCFYSVTNVAMHFLYFSYCVYRQEVKNSKEQVKTETHKAQIISSAPSSIKSSPVSSSHVAAGRSHLSQGFHASVGSQAMGSVTQQIRQRLHVGSTHMGHHNDGLESDDSVTSDSERQVCLFCMLFISPYRFTKLYRFIGPS